MKAEIERKALAYLGFAARAGRVTVGVPLICESMKKGVRGRSPLIVLAAADTSANTKKRIADRTAYYKTPLVELACNGEALALAVGKRGGTVGAVGVTEPSLAAAIAALYSIEIS